MDGSNPKTPQPVLAAGWAFAVVGARKAHYFAADQMMCLCGRVGFYTGPREDTFHTSEDNCVKCKRLLGVEQPPKKKRGGGGPYDHPSYD